ncbi:hypothetical protein N7481_008942 [Penicillium waksmanii]|uniref:uncharacterized protein n=1 Tax=Penicillium waksmanii TaxID=69791 RepID=UPI00254672CF|nr:uncharacterized protein N7481_008942 [Penicillium waksmanii]KAJ5975235.1 hypothetical protein N7481_008942 [Penicillium waksmanii]
MFTDPSMADWAKVASKNNGLSVQWTEDKDEANEWALKFLRDTLVIATGSIPVIGPILSIGTALTFQMLIDPDEFMDELAEQLPTFRLLEGMMFEMKKLTSETRKNMVIKLDVASSIQINATNTNSSDLVQKDPAQEQKADSEQSQDDSNEEYSTVPPFNAISKAEYDATIFKRIRGQIADKFLQVLIHPRLWPRK